MLTTIYYSLAIAAYSIFLIQFIISVCGCTDLDMDIDFDGDGKMSAFEQAVEFKFLHDVVMADRAEDKLAAAGLDKNTLGRLSEL